MQTSQVLHDTTVLICQKNCPLKKENFQKKIVIFEDNIKMVLCNYQSVLELNTVAPKKEKKFILEKIRIIKTLYAFKYYYKIK